MNTSNKAIIALLLALLTISSRAYSHEWMYDLKLNGQLNAHLVGVAGENQQISVSNGLLPLSATVTAEARRDGFGSLSLVFQGNMGFTDKSTSKLFYRDAFIKLQLDGVGTVKAGKQLPIFSGKAITSNSLLFAVGNPGSKERQQTTLGAIGAGHTFLNWTNGVSVTTASLSGYKGSVGVFFPEYSGWEHPSYHAQVEHDSFWLGALYQPLSTGPDVWAIETGYVFPVTESVSITAYTSFGNVTDLPVSHTSELTRKPQLMGFVDLVIEDSIMAVPVTWGAMVSGKGVNGKKVAVDGTLKIKPFKGHDFNIVIGAGGTVVSSGARNPSVWGDGAYISTGLNYQFEM